jgi:hypothetical protein
VPFTNWSNSRMLSSRLMVSRFDGVSLGIAMLFGNCRKRLMY